MKNLTIVCSIYVAFISFAGHLFGQLFWSQFDIYSTLAGIFGILAAVLTLLLLFRKRESKLYGFFILTFSILSCVGVLMDAKNYYSQHHVPGNSFGWELLGPFCLALLFIAYTGLNQFRHSNHRINAIPHD